MPMTRQDWRHRAACRNLDPEIFFPVAEVGPALARQEARALAVCARCPVRAECLAYALKAIPYGIAGGMTEGQRRALRTPAVPAPPGDPAPRRRPDPSPLAGRSHRGERVRAQGIALLLGGSTPREVAAELEVNERTAERWAARPEVRALVPRQTTRDPLSRRSLCGRRTGS
jgi:hypothetical protein